MLVLSLLVSLLVASAAANPHRRDANSIKASLDTITQKLHTLNETLNTFNGGFSGTTTALKIQGQTTDLGKAINSAADAANKSEPLGGMDSASVALAITTLTGNVFSVLDNIVRKKPDFDKAILGVGSASGLVKSDLQSLQKDTDKFGAAVTDKFVSVVKAVAPLVVSSLDYHFEDAIKAYS